MKWLFFLIPIFLFSCNESSTTDEWTLLFNEKNLDNWEIRNGTAEFHIEGNEIIGTSKLNTPNTFLCTKKMYSNFILELELKVDTPLNSGIQIRSNSIPEYYDGAVHGYQVEVDPSPRAFSGGIYDESRRGWIYPLCENQAGRKGFKNGIWNHYRIEAIGSAIRVWVNGIQTANLRDDMTASGFIGLQVHSVGKDSSMVGKTVRWRNIKIKTDNLEANRKVDDGKTVEINLVKDELSNREKKLGYVFFQKEKKYEDFDLKFEFKLSAESEGGVQYFSNKNKKAIFQIIDNNALTKEAQKGNQSIASLKDFVASKNICVEGRHRDFRGLDKWNAGRIIVQNGKFEHWMNGYQLLDVKAESIFSDWKTESREIIFETKKGEVEFRSIKIRKL